MRKLESTIYRNGFVYNLIERSDIAAIYEQRNQEDNELVGHEVFKIIVAPEGEVFGKMQPEREVFPGNEQFGLTAWSTGIDIERARAKYAKINVHVPVILEDN